MTDQWFEKMGFSENPFEINPLKEESRPLFDRQKQAEEVIYRIKSNNMLFIEGSKGKGKTALLRHAIDNFKGKGKVIYLDSKSLNKKLNIEMVLVGAKKMDVSKEKYPKNMILLLDNVEELSPRNNERIKYFFDQNYIQSVIFTGNNYKQANFSPSIESRIGKRIIKLSSLSQNGAVDMILERLGTLNEGMVDEDTIKYIYQKSKGDLKKFLINCYKVFDLTIKSNKTNVTNDIIDLALKKDLSKTSDFAIEIEEEKEIFEESKSCETCGLKLKKLGEYYRCKNCDSYCTGCGAYIIQEDEECPECGSSFA